MQIGLLHLITRSSNYTKGLPLRRPVHGECRLHAGECRLHAGEGRLHAGECRLHAGECRLHALEGKLHEWSWLVRRFLMDEMKRIDKAEAARVYDLYEAKRSKGKWRHGDLMYRQVLIPFKDFASSQGTVGLNSYRKDSPYVVFFHDGQVETYSKEFIEQHLIDLN